MCIQTYVKKYKLKLAVKTDQSTVIYIKRKKQLYNVFFSKILWKYSGNKFMLYFSSMVQNCTFVSNIKATLLPVVYCYSVYSVGLQSRTQGGQTLGRTTKTENPIIKQTDKAGNQQSLNIQQVLSLWASQPAELCSSPGIKGNTVGT